MRGPRYSGCMRIFFLALAALLWAGLAPAAAQIDRAPKVQTRLIAERDVAPGGTVTVALEEDIREGWHTYWKNPGDAGAPTAIEWQLPPGWSAGPIQWPYPVRLPVGPLMDYGYKNKVWLLSDVTAPANATPGVYILKAQASWLVCEEICIPEDGAVAVSVTVTANPAPAYATIAEQFAAARAKLPTPSPWKVTFATGEHLDLFIAAPQMAKAKPKDVSFFPLKGGTIVGPAPQEFAAAEGGLVLRLKAGSKAKNAKTIDGVIVVTSRDGSVQALDVSAVPGMVPATKFGASHAALSIWLALLFAALGGLILNLMPCVLPVLAMKALAIAGSAHGQRSAARRDGLAYGFGVLLSFLALGLALVLLRAGGEAIGWGFQLQEPVAVAGFALLIFAVGLNLSGVFELPGLSAGDALTRRGGAAGSFFTGILAVGVAAPCTAPFMAAALGFALTQSMGVSLAVFAALAVGFALPFVLIGFWPGLLRAVPKPGVWMLRFKQVLAFPMYGAAAWLVWVLAIQAGVNAVVAVLAAMIALSFGVWVWSASRGASAGWRMAGAILALMGLAAMVAGVAFIGASKPAAQTDHVSAAGLPSEAYSAGRLADLRLQNRAVFVDATAAWCITCLVNEKVAFENRAVRAAFKANNVAYLVADWTNRNPAVTQLLEAHGRSGVPLYLYFAPGAAEAKVLPQILTPDGVLDAINSR